MLRAAGAAGGLPSSDAELNHFAELEEWLSADPASYSRWIGNLGQRRLRDTASAELLGTIVTDLLDQLRGASIPAFACGEAMQICLSDLLLLEELDRTDVPAAAMAAIRGDLRRAAVDLVRRLLRNLALRTLAHPPAATAPDPGPTVALSDFADPAAVEPMRARRDEPVLVVTTAGRGTRLRSTIPKGLIPLDGAPMIDRVIGAASAAGIKQKLFVLRYGADLQREYLSRFGAVRVQPAAEGTGHSAFWGLAALPSHNATVLLSYSDTPFLHAGSLDRLLARPMSAGEALRLSAYVPARERAGRVVRDDRGDVARIDQPRLTVRVTASEADGGLYAMRHGTVFAALANLRNDNVRREYQFTDVVPLLCAAGLRATAAMGPAADFQSVDTPADLIMARLRAETGADLQPGDPNHDTGRAIATFFAAYGLADSPPATRADPAGGAVALAEMALARTASLVGPILDLRGGPR